MLVYYYPAGTQVWGHGESPPSITWGWEWAFSMLKDTVVACRTAQGEKLMRVTYEVQQDLLRTTLDSCWRRGTLPEAIARQGCGKTAGAPTDISSSENAKKTVCRWTCLNPSTYCTALVHWNCFKMWQLISAFREGFVERETDLTTLWFVKMEFYLLSSWKNGVQKPWKKCKWTEWKWFEGKWT